MRHVVRAIVIPTPRKVILDHSGRSAARAVWRGTRPLAAATSVCEIRSIADRQASLPCPALPTIREGVALAVHVHCTGEGKCPGFMMDGIMEAITREPLRAPCDRVMALVNRHLGDIAWNVLQLPEVLGAVNDETLTHAYTVARRASLNQVLESPAAVARPEIS